jgi:hypothetical protein
MQQLTKISSLVLILLMLGFAGCEGPAGEQGTQGPEGQQGPVGPAGEDGSMMYSGQGAPGSDIGDNDDYYLDTDTGEMYGPKDGDGWGNPIMVLMGQDGQDGEDGSQIHAGSGAPSSSLGQIGDFYLDQANYDMYGPKTDQGWGSPINLKGADGNANVTRYLFPSHDFGATPNVIKEITNVTRTEMIESAWLVYLIGPGDSRIPVPGFGYAGDEKYNVTHRWNQVSSTVNFAFSEETGKGDQYEIEIVRIESSNAVDMSKQAVDEIIPKDLDITNYQEVAKYYSFYR